ncbi:MAG: PSD1 and planctomycete cytochrome C domain-containing protein [Planctomycetaceae bacterium]
MSAQSLFTSLALLIACGTPCWSGAIDFQRDIQPILAGHCTQCHGVDAKERKGGLRLDERDSALRGGDSGEPALIPGQPLTSELLRRILSDDPSEQMPPPSAKTPLNSRQIELLKQWITEGAVYAGHWAFQPPHKSQVPPGPTHPIDAFISRDLSGAGLSTNGPASSAALCRRVYLDLIGLPPSPEDLVEFERDGLSATIRKLLASDRFGEKWARHWLDAARYSDTNGYEKDLQREQWVWRDWVIEAFNRDLPYDQFLIEQFAGDLLPNATPSQLIATGLLRNSMINEEGAIVPEQFRMVEMFDRIDCLGKAVMGLSTQCAQCHSHKFDPLTHTEYYGLFAFLNDTYEAQSWVYTPEQHQQIQELHAKIEAAEERWRVARPGWIAELAAWSRQIIESQAAWEPLEAIEMGSISGLNHPTQERDRSFLMKGHTSNDVFFVGAPALEGITGLRLEVLNHRDLPQNGPGRTRQGSWTVQELEVLVRRPGEQNFEKQKLARPTADFSEPEQKQANGKSVRGPVELLIDGSDETVWAADRGPGLRNHPSAAVIQFEQPLNCPPGTQFKVVLRMGEMAGCIRISLTRSPDPKAGPVDHGAVLALAKEVERQSAGERAAVFAAWRKSHAEAQPITDEIATLWKSYPQAATTVLHLAERNPDDRRPTHLLDRGNWDQPREVVEPHVPAAFHPLPADAPRNRLTFARWLADPKSPFTARVAVNRVWQAIFGNGLVETAEDFGTRSPYPEHRELLDWLSVEFMERGWSHKQLIELIMTSEAYQRDSSASPESLQRDPRNAFLARGPRFRAEAEVVRDIALTISGLIHHRVGGPGVIPPVPQNVLDYNYVYPAFWKPAEGPERYRRTVYGFRKRSMPDPVMSNFDAPNGDFSCARRVRSNTPLAALTGLNETIFVEAARGLALRVLRESGPSDEERIERAWRLCTLRPPTADERRALEQLLASRRRKLAEGWLNPREIITGNPAQLPELPPGSNPQDAAAWTLVSRVLLNLDETISKN